MRVRLGTDADAEAAAALVRQVLHEHGLPFEPRTLDADILRPDGFYAASGGAFYVATDDAGRVIGTAGLYLSDPASGELRKMFLLPEARGHGLGRTLLDTVLEAARARDLARLTLVTRYRYDRAIRLYERAGFRLRGSARRPRGNDQGLVYELDLKPDRVPGRPAGRPRRSFAPALAA